MNIFVGCSSSSDIPKEYLEDANNCLNELFEGGHNLIFGACNNGIMGIAYNCALKNDRKITGICPEIYKDDFLSLNCDTELLTNSISDRTDKIIEESEILLFLPGGIGTIYELLTVLESKRSGEFNKPILIYNSNGFFDRLLNFFQKLYNENFTSSNVSNNYCIFNNYKDLIDYLNELDKESDIITLSMN